MICPMGFVFPGVRGKTAQNALYGGGASLVPCTTLRRVVT
jgi:hypothetical protein